SFPMRHPLLCLLTAAGLLTTIGPAACAHAGSNAPAPAPIPAPIRAGESSADADGEMQSLIARFAADESDINGFYSITWSETRLNRLETLYKAQQARLSEVNFDGLDQDGKVDYLLQRNKLRNNLAYNALSKRRMQEMAEVLPFRGGVCELEERRWKMERVDARAAAESLAKIPEMIKSLRASIEKGQKDGAGEGAIKVSGVVAQRASSAARTLRSTMRAWYDYYAQFEPGFSWWVEKPFQDADRAIEEYAAFLRRDIAGLKGEDSDPLIGDPIGRETLVEDLRNEFIPYSPEELIEIAKTQFAWCENEMKKAAAEMGMGDDWKKALEKVKNSYVEPGEQTHYCTSVVREQIEWLQSRDLLTLPDLTTELWRLEMITPDRQKFWPFQYYGGLHIGVGYASDQQSLSDRLQVMRGNNKHFTRLVVPHELIPGHHLQGYMAERFKPYRRGFSTPFFVEGWCLYWEFKHWDMGWARGPEDRIGMLFWRMHRAARIIVSLQFHLGTMSPEEMVTFLVDRVGHEKNNAMSEVRRYIGGDYAPLYQVGYMMGGLQIRAMHTEAVESGTMKEKEFNDAVLTQGSIPVELVRAALLKTPLSRDAEASWKFADTLPGK
ncbi:MAG TPA: DUF885 family protein, partial [Phycisphaerales bacterium]|nr:DUF885 family protein [Phycisphaerales bacterium]